MVDEQHLEFERPATKGEERAAARPPAGPPPLGQKIRLRDQIPQLPDLGVDPDTIKKPDQRAVACVNMRIAGAPFHEIAKQLEYESAASAKSAYVSALANLYPQEAMEQLRQTEAMRAEQQLRRSVAMASAEYLLVRTGELDDDGNEIIKRVPNTDRLRWHEQAGKDLALHAAITGAKAPTRVEIAASVQELNEIAAELIQAEGTRDIEADVFDLDEIEAEVVEEE